MSENSILNMFIPTANGRATLELVETWGDGPHCECTAFRCPVMLPKAAWLYVAVEGQFVVAPGHQMAGSEFYELDGFTVEKEGEEEKRSNR